MSAPLSGAATPSIPLGVAHSIAAQSDESAAAADAERELSRLEAARDFDTLYELMHPDAREVVPRSAVVGWYTSYLSSRDVGEVTVRDVTFEPWTWPVTGVTYDDAATVSYVQPYWTNGVLSEVSGEVHLVPAHGEWGWFFGASRAFVDEQIALYGDDGTATVYALAQGTEDETAVSREALFPDPLHAHIDKFWTARFAEAGRAYDPPNGVIPFSEPIVTACGRAEPEHEAAFYCVIDEKI
jgi:hypothetical protein